ncbi:hypothetical protein VNO78_19821 [Psophocarpus tetragonolobus]|uniref:Uncharacterized protein n=1 Tax=Psophocarpus tetragonolobus TaxID=3891 RepID=A0AAN9XGL2_PSOTE
MSESHSKFKFNSSKQKEFSPLNRRNSRDQSQKRETNIGKITVMFDGDSMINNSTNVGTRNRQHNMSLILSVIRKINCVGGSDCDVVGSNMEDEGKKGPRGAKSKGVMACNMGNVEARNGAESSNIGLVRGLEAQFTHTLIEEKLSGGSKVRVEEYGVITGQKLSHRLEELCKLG